jgi:hypothetical protein
MMLLAITMFIPVLGEEMRTDSEMVGPTEAQFRPGGSRSLPYFQHLPAFAPELLVLSAAALVAFRCSRVRPDEPPRKANPELKRSGSSSSVGSSTPSSQTKRAGALAKQVHRAYHGGDYATVLCVWAEVTAQLKGARTENDAPLEMPALKLVVKAMLEGAEKLSEKQIEQVALYVEFAGMEAGPDASASGLLQAAAQWQASHASLAGLESLRPLADRLGALGTKSADQVASVAAMAGCYAMHGRTAEVDELLALENCPTKVFDEAIQGYLKGPQVQVTKDGIKVRLLTAIDAARRLKQQGGTVSSNALTLLFEHARETQVVALFQETLQWGPLPQAVVEVVARQAFDSHNVELAKQVWQHVKGGKVSHGTLLPLIRLFLACGDGRLCAELFTELCSEHSVSARTCTLLLRAETPMGLPLQFLDQVLAFCRSRHYFDLPASRTKADTSETATLYAAAMTAFTKVPERLHMAVALDNQLSMLGLDREKRPIKGAYRAPAERSAQAEDISRSDCVVAARRMLQLARGQQHAAPLSAPPGL